MFKATIVVLVTLYCLIPTLTWAEDAYTLGAGDRLRITIFGIEDMSGEVEVDSSGEISLPLIQKVPAAGLTVAQLQADITRRLVPDYIKNPRITIEIVNYRPFYIFGEVQKPGSYPYVAGMTVVNAIAVAGGFTYRADKDDIMISRGPAAGRKTIQAQRTDAILPGDVVEVKERFF